MDKTDSDYFRIRAQQCREMAMKAPQPEAQRAHREMADRYAARAAAPEPVASF